MMNRIDTRSLRWLGVAAPLTSWAAWVVLKLMIWQQPILFPATFVELLIITVGATLFAHWIATNLERGEAEALRRSEHLEALRKAGLALTTELDIAKVLQQVVDQSRVLVQARYGALAVMGFDGQTIEQFYTSGLNPESHDRLVGAPLGAGILGVLGREGEPMRIADIAADARAIGFPEGHPAMHTLVGVPIASKGKYYGNLYLTDKRVTLPSGGVVDGEFTQEDQDLLGMFAIQAAIAVENAQLYRENQQIAILRERERIGMDLHDGVIQSIYAIGLLLDDAGHRIDTAPEQTRDVIGAAITGLNDVIVDIRNYIQHLRPQRFQGRNIKQGLEALAQELRTDTLLSIELKVDEQAAIVCTARQADEFLHIAQEALTNVRKHAAARAVKVQFGFEEGLLQLSIQDDGVGMDPAQVRRSPGNGLRNLRSRARALHGEFRLETAPGAGARLMVTAPIEKRDA
ncbi:MAG: GAF domain-containing sensor histidine kinase [Caldilineaceae bacterium]|nr:GAF domain-containing sensor histidine kinase [Caldilineaceae bacterium]